MPNLTDAQILIMVDFPVNRPFSIAAGPWLVRDFKRHVGVAEHKVLARIDPFGLTALADDETVEIRDGERFMSHVRPGVSS